MVAHTCDAVTSPLEENEVEGEKEYLLSKDDEIDGIENKNVEYVLKGMRWKERVVATMLILNQRSLRCVEETSHNESERKQKNLIN